MSPTAQFQAFAQSVYLVIKNRYFDDLTSDDGIVFMQQVADWTNQFLDELEAETNPDGEPINWTWVRSNSFTLGTAATGDASIPTPTAIQNLIAAPGRYVQILQDGTPVSHWAVVNPDDISSLTDRVTEDMCAIVGSNIVFSRAFKATENNGTIIGDVVLPIPRVVLNASTGTLVVTNAKVLTTVKPKQLLVLGVAKNATLPDIVQGGLSPSYTQKFNDLLLGAVARNTTSSSTGFAGRDDLSFIGGVGM